MGIVTLVSAEGVFGRAWQVRDNAVRIAENAAIVLRYMDEYFEGEPTF